MEPDFAKLTGFQWDGGNSSKSLTKHRVTVQEAESVFADPDLKILDDPGYSKTEPRYKAFGKTPQARFLTISFTVRGLFVRIISARPMNRKERNVYEHEISE